MRTKKCFGSIFIRSGWGKSLGGGQNDISTADLKEHLCAQNRKQKDLMGAGDGMLCGDLGLERAWRTCKKGVGSFFWN